MPVTHITTFQQKMQHLPFHSEQYVKFLIKKGDFRFYTKNSRTMEPHSNKILIIHFQKKQDPMY